MMENLGLLLLTGGISIIFVIIPAFVFLLCVRRVNEKWHIKKDGIALYLYGKEGIVHMIPENMCELYCVALIPEAVCLAILFVIISFGFLCFICYSFASEHPKAFLILLLIDVLAAIIIWKASAYAKTESWQNRKKKISQTFQKTKQRIEGKICIKFENI